MNDRLSTGLRLTRAGFTAIHARKARVVTTAGGAQSGSVRAAKGDLRSR